MARALARTWSRPSSGGAKPQIRETRAHSASSQTPTVSSGGPSARDRRDWLAQRMTPAQIAEAQRLAAKFKPRPQVLPWQRDQPIASIEQATAAGSGFFVTDDGYFVTN